MERKSQVWIETVIYTLIGLAIITALLAIVRPVIQEKQDQIIIEQSLDMINYIDTQVEDVRYYGVGNSRPVSVTFKKGNLFVSGAGEYIEFSMEGRHMYSELDRDVEIGRVRARTIETEKGYKVFLILNYTGSLDLTWQGQDEERTFQPAPTPHKITITNNGSSAGGLLQIDFTSI